MWGAFYGYSISSAMLTFFSAFKDSCPSHLLFRLDCTLQLQHYLTESMHQLKTYITNHKKETPLMLRIQEEYQEFQCWLETCVGLDVDWDVVLFAVAQTTSSPDHLSLQLHTLLQKETEIHLAHTSSKGSMLQQLIAESTSLGLPNKMTSRFVSCQILERLSSNEFLDKLIRSTIFGTWMTQTKMLNDTISALRKNRDTAKQKHLTKIVMYGKCCIFWLTILKTVLF